MAELERQLAEHVSSARLDILSSRAVNSAKSSLIDTLSAMLAGASTGGFDRVAALVRQWGGAAEAHIVGTALACPAPVAAWANGISARRLELDDIVDFAPAHPSATVIAALLPLCEHPDSSVTGPEFISALAVAQDVNIRFARSLRDDALSSGRYNLFRVFGVTAGVCNLLRLPANVTQHALGIAYAFACGETQSVIEGAESLSLQDGEVSHRGLLAALLAAKGLTGASRFLTGRHGLYRAFEPESEPGLLAEGLGRKFWGEEVSYKPYAACRAAHPAIEAALLCRQQADFAPDDVEEILIEVTPAVHELVFPDEDPMDPLAPNNVLFSLPFLVAIALVLGQEGISVARTDAAPTPELRRLASKVKGLVRKPLRPADILGTTLFRATGKGGAQWSVQVERPLGCPDRPFGSDAVWEKLHRCAALAKHPMPEQKLRETFHIVSHLEAVDCMRRVVDNLHAGTPQ